MGFATDFSPAGLNADALSSTHVHEDNVGSKPNDFLDRLCCGGGPTDDSDVMIVHDGHTKGLAATSVHEALRLMRP